MTRLSEMNRRYAANFEDRYALVPGEGEASARLLLVGEAPGAQETLLGRPFVGQAGKNLDAFLAAVALPRAALYITNAVKFRPTKQGASGRLSNRTPTRDEVDAFQPWLHAEIEAVQPLIVATLGNTALRAVAGDGFVIGAAHGRPLAKRLACGAHVFPLYHPASVIYRRELTRTYAEDVEALRAFLETVANGKG